jgi:hypothetical protein
MGAKGARGPGRPPKFLRPAGLRINLGCANRPLQGYLNLDMQALPGVDLVYRIDPFRPVLPFKDSTAVEIEANNFVEHIADTVGLVTEMWRVSRDGARWRILTPGYRDVNSWRDPNHLSHWEERCLDFFTPDGFDGRRYGPALLSYAVTGGNDRGLDFQVTVHKPGDG